MKYFSYHLACSYNNFYRHSYFSQLVKPCTVICCCWFNGAEWHPFSEEHKRSLSAIVNFMYYANNALEIHAVKCESEGEFISLGS